MMDKYSKTLLKIFSILIGSFCIVVGMALIGVSVWVSTFSDVASMIFILSFLGGGCLINFGVGYAFLEDRYKATHLVRDGKTVFAPVETPRFLKRRKIATFIGFISYVFLAVYYIVRIVLESIYMGYLKEVDFNTSIVALAIFAALSLGIAFIFFMVYKKTKHIDLNEE